MGGWFCVIINLSSKAIKHTSDKCKTFLGYNYMIILQHKKYYCFLKGLALLHLNKLNVNIEL